MYIYNLKKNFMILLLYLININKTNSEGFTSVLSGNSNGGKNNYYITLYIGQPKKSQTLLIDTTGSITSSPCNLHPSYNINSNDFYIIREEHDIINCQNNTCQNYPYSSCINKQCNFEYNYNNSTIKGVYVNQHISFLEETKSNNFPIGCTQSETNDFSTQNANGILGLNDNENSFTYLLYKNNIIQKRIFSICLNQNEGGYLSFGKIEEEYHYQRSKSKNVIISYIPYKIFENGKYSLEINSINIEKRNNLLNNNEKQKSIIDSLSVKTHLTESIYNNLINDFLFQCLSNKDNCNNIKKDENFGYCSNFKSKQKIIKTINKYWPNIIIGFNGYNHVLSPQNYFIAYSTSNYIKACIGFEKTNHDYNILGTTFLNGYDVIFDNDNKRIGFVESKCQFKIKKIDENINRVFDDPVNIIIVCASVGGIIILIVILFILYREFYNKQPKRKGYIRQVDVFNSFNSYNENKTGGSPS